MFLNRKKHAPLSLFFYFIFFTAGFSHAQTAISGLEFNGQSTNQAYITVTPPKQKATQITAQVNQRFESGTLFQVPKNTVVYLTSSAGNSQRLGPGSRHQVTASAQGESHRTFFGQVKHFVKDKLNFYKASGPNQKYQGAVEGTVFTVQAEGHNVKFLTSEGSVSVQRKVPINVSENASVNRSKERELYTIKTSSVTAGGEAFYDYNSAEAINYTSYEDAIKEFKYQLDQGYYNGADPYYLADEYTLLGGLYLDNGNAYEAIDPFIKSLNLWYAIDPSDPFISENYLDLSEAYYLAGYRDEGDKYWNTAITIIDNEYKYVLDEYNYFYDLGDYDTAWAFGMDLVDMYESLAWAYEVKESVGYAIEYNYQSPEYWYGQADDLSSILDQF